MRLYEIEKEREKIFEKYKAVLKCFFLKCMLTDSLQRALSAYRNYETFAYISHMYGIDVYNETYDNYMNEMQTHIEELAQKE